MATPNRAQRRASVKDIKKAVLVDLTLPSGFVVLAKRPGLNAFLGQGVIPNSLLPALQAAMNEPGEKKTETEKVLQDLSKDTAKINEMLEMFDAVTMAVMVDPPVAPIPSAEEDRDEEVLYVDEVPFDDKQFLFQWAVGGTADLERFREQQAASMERMAAVPGDALPPIPTVSD